MAAGLIGIIVEGGETFYAAACAPRLELEYRISRSKEKQRGREAKPNGGAGGRDKEKKRWKATKPIGATRKILPVSWLRSPGNSRTNEVPHPSAAF